MSDIHVVASGPKAEEIVSEVLAEFDRWAEHAPSQASGVYPGDSDKAASYALGYVRTDLADHLIVRIGVLLSSWGVSDE